MRVAFRLKNRQIELDVSENWSILFLKQRVCQDLDCDSQSHFLAHGAIQLNDWDNVSQLDLFKASQPLINVRPYSNINHFYVLCYQCDDVTPAVFEPHCTACFSSNFSLTSNIVCPEIRRVPGVCKDCNATEARVEFACFHETSHHPIIFLRQVQKNLSQSTCIACCENTCEVIVTFCENLGHSLCVDCFRSYAESYLSDARFVLVPDIGLTLRCPVGCPDSNISETHIFRLLGTEFYSHYKETAAKVACYSEGFCNCPQCGAYWEMPDDARGYPWVLCEKPYGCGVEFCTHCRRVVSSDGERPSRCICQSRGTLTELRGAHGEDVTFSATESAWSGIRMAPSDLASRCLIAVTCKPCPRCRSQTNKDGGCNHVQCSVCGLEWCWICSKNWDRACQNDHWFWLWRKMCIF